MQPYPMQYPQMQILPNNYTAPLFYAQQQSQGFFNQYQPKIHPITHLYLKIE